eukprot:365569-Chlamydomonas_euryale.AAC.10
MRVASPGSCSSVHTGYSSVPHSSACSSCGDGFGDTLSPCMALASSAVAACLRVLRSGSERQLMVRWMVATYALSSSGDTPALVAS